VDAAIAIVWAVTLILALALTVPIVAELVRIVHHARQIDRLARTALPAAQGIAGNTAVIAALAEVVPVVARLSSGAAALDATTASIARRVAAIRRGLTGGR